MAASGVVLRGGEAIQPAEACGWGGPTIVDLTTFDPAIVGDRDGLLYEPDVHGFGGPCDDCAHKELLAEWSVYLKEAVTAKDWERVLFQATPLELQAISARLAGKATTGPKAFDASSLFKGPPALRDKLRGAVAFVELARGIEPF
ncbi:MAG: hypothetical protein NT062_00275, partial [Proteobacteria bacterium]|nr:hypothetical protein [Pseudomonadota bacterium]